MGEVYTTEQITGWVSGYLREKGFKTEVYSNTFLPARVPVFAGKDAEKGKEQSAEEIVVDVINSRNIKCADFFYDLHIGRTITEKGKDLLEASSARFFQYYFPRAKIYWAYPDYLTADVEFERFRETCRKFKIGLLKVGKGMIEEDMSMKPVSLIESLSKKFRLSILPSSESSSKHDRKKHQMDELTEKLYKELDSHIERTNEYLIYYPEPEYKRREIVGRVEGRNISLKLIDKMAEIENLNYAKSLHKLSSEYRLRIEDDYDIALDLVEGLWKEKGVEYPRFQKNFEPVLLLDPRYRDHYLHQFHVFLLGCYILDRMYREPEIKRFNKRFSNPVEDVWLFASSYHDYNYSIQNYNEWIASFFRNTLFLNRNPTYLRLDECYVKEDYMFKTKELCDAFGIGVDRTALLFFYEKIINDKNHAFIGALSLLKLFDQSKTAEIKRDSLLLAAKAIALHDEDIWMHFAGRTDIRSSYDKEVLALLADFSRKKVLENLRFGDDPISFLLIFCDTIQEWGRVGRDYEKTEAKLDDVSFSDNTLLVNISVRDEDAFNKKKSEIDRVKKFLMDERFSIKLKTREEREEINVERRMTGK